MLDPAVTGRVLETYRAARQAQRDPDDGALNRLTARELTVLELIGRGMSNEEIAAELYISVVTVKSHVGGIFRALGVRDRAAAVVFAFDHGVVRPR